MRRVNWPSMGPRSNSRGEHFAALDSMLKTEEGYKLQVLQGQVRAHTFVNEIRYKMMGTSCCPGEMEQKHSPRDSQSPRWGKPVLQAEYVRIASGRPPTRDPFIRKPSLLPALSSWVLPEEPASRLPWLLI